MRGQGRCVASRFVNLCGYGSMNSAMGNRSTVLHLEGGTPIEEVGQRHDARLHTGLAGAAMKGRKKGLGVSVRFKICS